MTTADELKALLSRAPNDGYDEAVFLRALLTATLYSLAPLSDDHPRLRLFMYQRPDGVYFIPLFTDEVKASASASGVLRVLSCTGRELLEATRGAVIVINPNDEHCTLYPEEIAALLTTGQVPLTNVEILAADREMWFGEPESPPEWLIERLRTLYADLPFVEAARLATVAPSENSERRVLTVVIVTPTALIDRALSATNIAIRGECRAKNVQVDMIGEPSDGPDPSLGEIGMLIYAKKR